MKRIFRFLRALDQHRIPAKRRIGEQLRNLWLEPLPDHEAVEFEYPIDISEADAEATGDRGPEQGLLRGWQRFLGVFAGESASAHQLPAAAAGACGLILGDLGNPPAEVSPLAGSRELLSTSWRLDLWLPRESGQPTGR